MKRHIQYNWWKYATAIIASVVLWCAVFNSLAMPDENEKLHILFVGEGLEREKLEQAVSEMLPSVTEQSVRQVKVQQVRLHGREAFRILDGYTYQYDIIIISESYFQENMGLSILSRAMTEQVLAHFQEAEPMSELYEGAPAICGFVLPEQGSFDAFYPEEDVCYIFPSAESVNFDGLNGKGLPGDDCALRIMEYLLGIDQE